MGSQEQKDERKKYENSEHFQLLSNYLHALFSVPKVADAMFKWEKYGKTTHSNKELKLTFKKRLFLGTTRIPDNQVEFDLVFYQVRERERERERIYKCL